MQYRIYILSPRDRIDDSREGFFPDDRAALDAAAQIRRDRFAAEVWAGERLVGRLGAEFSL